MKAWLHFGFHSICCNPPTYAFVCGVGYGAELVPAGSQSNSPNCVPQVNVCLIVQTTVPSLTLIIEGMGELVTHHHPNPPKVQSPENTEQGLRFFQRPKE